MKSGMQTYFILVSYAFRSKVLILLIVKKIRDPEKIHPRSRGVKKDQVPDPDPQHCSRYLIWPDILPDSYQAYSKARYRISDEAVYRISGCILDSKL
jgi:hypothetical protein